MPNFELAQERIKAAQRGDFSWFNEASDGVMNIPAVIEAMIHLLPPDSESYSRLALALMEHSITIFTFEEDTLICKHWDLLYNIIEGIDVDSPIIPVLIKYMLDSCDTVLKYMTTYEIDRDQYNEVLIEFLNPIRTQWSKYIVDDPRYKQISDVAKGCSIETISAPNPSYEDYMKAIKLTKVECDCLMCLKTH